MKAQFRPDSEKRVKTSLVLEKIAKVEALEVSDDEVNSELEKMAEQNKMTVDEIKKYVNLDDVKENLLMNKTVKFVTDNAVVK